jgi:ABC-type enterobactin transport system permease subunit
LDALASHWSDLHDQLYDLYRDFRLTMPLLILLLQCVCMLAASLLVGGLPLMFKSATSGGSWPAEAR